MYRARVPSRVAGPQGPVWFAKILIFVLIESNAKAFHTREFFGCRLNIEEAYFRSFGDGAKEYLLHHTSYMNVYMIPMCVCVRVFASLEKQKFCQSLAPSNLIENSNIDDVVDDVI